LSGEISEGQPTVTFVPPLEILGTYSVKPDDQTFIPVQIKLSSGELVTTTALIDCGATSNFVNQAFVHAHHLPVEQKKYPVPVHVVDGRPIISGDVNYHSKVDLIIGPHQETIQLDVTNLGNHSVILGTPWLRLHNPRIDWKRNHLEFFSSYCGKSCISSPPIVPALPLVPHILEPSPLVDSVPDPNSVPPSSSDDSVPDSVSPPSSDDSVPDSVSPSSPDDSAPAPIPPSSSDDCQTVNTDLSGSIPPPPQIAFIGPSAFRLACTLPGSIAGILPIRYLQDSVSLNVTETHPSEPQPFDDGLPDPPEYAEKLKEIVPSAYHDLLPAFSKKRADTLPPHRLYDHSIDLEPGTNPPYGPLYTLSEVELHTLSEWLEENLSKGFIRSSRSPAGSPVLFVKKKDGTLRLCVDYRGLNKITIKNRYPLPLIPETIDRLHRAKVFTKLDLRSAFNLIRIKEGDEWKTAFRTRYGHFECLVMPFGLTNAPASMQHFVNDVFRDILDVFVVVYIDDILIYSQNPEEHQNHVRRVLERLIENGLYVKAEKSEFFIDTIEFLGYIISPEGVSMAQSKVQAVLDWPTPATVREVQQFLGFANFYRRFIDGYSRIISPITKLIRKSSKFLWSSAAEEAFKSLKHRFTSAPILKHYNPALQSVIETDSSDFAISAILSQYHDGILHPIAFMSRKMAPAEQNYDIREKELLALVVAVKLWRHYLEGSELPFKILTDHESLKYFQSSRTLSRRQARWSEEINHHRYVIEYRPGSKNGKADALSRRRDFAEGGKASDTEPQTLLKPIEINALSLAPDLENTIKQYLQHDPVAQNILNNFKSNHDSSRSYSVVDDLLFRDGLIYIPDYEPLKVQILQSCHDSPVSGHFGQVKTHELVTRNFYWPGLRTFVNDYVLSCEECQRAKPSHHRKYGLLQPLPIPPRPWSSLSLDHIVDLPSSHDFDCILVVVCRRTKMAHFIPTKKTDTAKDLAQQFTNRIFSLHGLPDDLVSDRGPTFTSNFWKEILSSLKIKSNLSTAFHPESDGQTERINRILEQYLRLYVNYLQDDWSDFLPMAEFAYNNSFHTSIGMTPFYANYGYHPRLEVTLKPSLLPSAEEWSRHLHSFQNQLEENLKASQATYARYANLNRIPNPPFKEGDKVWLIKRHIFTTRPSDKLDSKRLGPFVIEKKISNTAFRLKLPASMKIHPTFHVSLLESYIPNTLPSRQPLSAPDPEVLPTGEEAYEVEKILDSRIRYRKLMYFVHWTGYPVEERSWTPATDFHDDDSLVVDFHTAYPDKPGHERIERSRS
jgi:transposase InsO family protein